MSRSTPNFAPIDGADTAMMPLAPLPNGRIDLLTQAPRLNIPNYQNARTDNAMFAAEATAGKFQRTALSDLFFSAENINALQEGIRYRVYVESDGKYVIGRQSDTELKIVMRSIFIDWARHNPDNIVGQVRELNGRVLAWVVPEVYSNLKQHETYRRDASTMPMPLERSPLMTSKGSRTLEQKAFF